MRTRARAIACLLVALACCAGAAAEAVWTGFFDYYYHAAPGCALAGSTFAIDRETAESERNRRPCPACVPDAAEYPGIEAVVRGGTAVVRVPDGFGRAVVSDAGGDIEESFAPYWSADAVGAEAARTLAELLHGADYLDFLERYAEEGACRAELIRPEIAAPDEAWLAMNARHIGGAWLFTVRPGEAEQARMDAGGTLDLDLRFAVGAVSLDGGRLTAACNRQMRFEDTVAPVHSQNKTAFVQAFDAVDLAVYEDIGAFICVLHEAQPEPAGWLDVALLLDGADVGIRLNGYWSGGYATYCCTLTGGELEALLLGATPSLRHPEAEAGGAP